MNRKVHFSEVINKCPRCGKEFEVTIIYDNFPGGRETEGVWCPYCYFLGYIITSGLPETHKITGQFDYNQGSFIKRSARQ